MTTYSLTLSGQSYTVSTSDAAQIAAITACRAAYNASLPQTVAGTPVTDRDGEGTTPQIANPALIATDTAYLQMVFGNWATANVGFTNQQLQDVAASAFASYANQNPPEQVVQQPLTGDALKVALSAYAEAKHTSVLNGGTTIAGVRISTDTGGRIDMAGAVSLAQLVPSHVFDWVGASGAIQLTATQVIQIGTAVALWVQSTYTTLGTVLASIQSGGITTPAQIDTANWPANT